MAVLVLLWLELNIEPWEGMEEVGVGRIRGAVTVQPDIDRPADMGEL